MARKKAKKKTAKKSTGAARLPPKKQRPAKKKSGRGFPKAGSSKAPDFKSIANPVVETEHVELGGGTWRGGERYTLTREYIDCGRCPKAHGPYWYASKRKPSSWPERQGKLVRVYVGKIKDKAKAERLLREHGALR